MDGTREDARRARSGSAGGVDGGILWTHGMFGGCAWEKKKQRGKGQRSLVGVTCAKFGNEVVAAISPYPNSSIVNMNARALYLCTYNAVQLYLWSRVIMQGFLHISHLSVSPLSRIFHAVLPYAHLAQTLAWLEPLHAIVGLAGASFNAAFIQSLARYVVLVFVIEPIQLTHSNPITLVLIFAWALGDVVRYLFYIATAASYIPYWLLWLRYSLFMPLYPVGMISEWLLYFLTLSHIAATNLYSVSLPNPYNFAFSFHIWNKFVLLLYIPMAPKMYSHMLRQRRKKLRPT